MIRTTRTVAVLFAVTIPLLFTACTDEQVAQFEALDAPSQAAVIAHLQTSAEPPAHTHQVRTSFWIPLGARCLLEQATAGTVTQLMHHHTSKTQLQPTQ